FEIAFPSELNQEQRLAMLEELCASIVERHQVAVDACIHAPHTGSGSDERNYHAHILMSTRKLTPEGFTEKTRELD
ncbi:MobA/MobL family protein, partial [Acinetobacter baumannii]